MRSFCAHQKGNFLNFAKLTLLLSLDHSWLPLWPVKRYRAFFLGHPVLNMYFAIYIVSVVFQSECKFGPQEATAMVTQTAPQSMFKSLIPIASSVQFPEWVGHCSHCFLLVNKKK